MIMDLMKYGGVACKVRAMYGRRLTDDDFAQIRGMNTVYDVAQYLRNHPAWSQALTQIPPGEIHRGELEKYLRIQILDEYQRIFQFMGHSDAEIMSYPIIRAELDQILIFLRHLKAGQPEDYHFSAPEFYRRHSNIDFDRLTECTNYVAFLDVIQDTPFYAPMVALASSEKGTPSYTAMEVVLRSYYYHRLLKTVDRHYKGAASKQLRKAMGSQVDLINITRTIRIRKFFSQMEEQLTACLIPVFFRLKPDFFTRLAACESDDEAHSLLLTCPYAKIFAENEFQYIEEYYYKQLYDYNRRCLSNGTPTVYTPIAYLTLKELEMKKLINLVECVRYKVPHLEIPSALVGI